MNTVQTVTKYIEPIIKELNFELVDLEFIKQGSTYYLRLYIDKDGGITIDDCQIASRKVEVVLDEKDPIKDPYMLEVSSPGLDRVIKKDADFIKFANRIVDVKLYKPISSKISKQKHIQAKLIKKTTDEKTNDDILILEMEDGELLNVDFKNIASVRLAILF
ncbi:ribosome maturation factor RimP [Candidatus Epulonipiscium fishelsonii]|uniref:Ribosome maturation factor RimP n=1 Tax=Candidatus Epulonipiscium fishelsonii TaxID=77094 RepID=A0ACC8XFP0_9FIRM|nr:ribosome maturation factor RimP [Epulopiscium sp. SCG-B11WGA-EpuloA1]ONI42873.1 ribosome maturation factor RimP [Epulopiscium sp. SCG-B05WGA-EpuloA1]